jgi:hypothetical protein
MITKSEIEYILENREDLNSPIFKDVTFSKYYRSVPESSGWRVVIGFQTPNDPNWREVETDWAWLPENVRNSVTKHP